MIQIIKTTVLASSILLMSFTPIPQGDIHTSYSSKSGTTAFSFSKEMIDALDFDMDVNDTKQSGNPVKKSIPLVVVWLW